jgi:hypothetical protein
MRRHWSGTGRGTRQRPLSTAEGQGGVLYPLPLPMDSYASTESRLGPTSYVVLTRYCARHVPCGCPLAGPALPPHTTN